MTDRRGRQHPRGGLPTHQPSEAPAIRVGRPRDNDLTRRLLLHAGDLVIHRGIDALTAETLSQAAGAGKASVYRRWPGGIVDVHVELVTASRVVPLPDRGTAASAQVDALLTDWAAPPTRAEQILVNFLGTVVVADARLHQALRSRIDEDLHRWWQSAGVAEPAVLHRSRTTMVVLRAMLVARLSRGPLGRDEIAFLRWRLIDHPRFPSAPTVTSLR